MKKIFSFVLVCTMLASMLVIGTNAANPLGTVVEATFTTTAPSMKAALPDASWGNKVITVNKNSANAGITDYMKGRGESTAVADQSLSFDVYLKWTDTTLYLCFTSPDKYIRGSQIPTRGDGFQINMIYGVQDMSHYNAELCTTSEEFVGNYSYCVTTQLDDYSTDLDGAALLIEQEPVLYWDEKAETLVCKIAVDFTELGAGKNEKIGNGSFISIAMIRIDGQEEETSGYTGWLEWGDFFNGDKSYKPGDTHLNVPASMNTKTTTSNTIKLAGDTRVGTTPSVEVITVEPEKKQETPATTTEKPSSWAAEEVNASIALGLVPTELQKSYTTGITRGQLALMLTSLLQKAGVTMPTATGTASFTDTTDANVIAAANLGIINGYKQADGTYMFKPNNTLKRSEMSAIINRVAKLCGKTTTGFEKEVTFTDTASHWCNSELGYPVHMGIVKGTSATTFSPENTLTIEQTIMMVYRTLNALAK